MRDERVLCTNKKNKEKERKWHSYMNNFEECC